MHEAARGLFIRARLLIFHSIRHHLPPRPPPHAIVNPRQKP